MITNKNIFFAMGLMSLCQQLQASDKEVSPLVHLPDAAFIVQADNMSFKDLYALSQTSKDGLEKVKKYFEFKENIFKNTKCPVLTKEKIINFSKEEQKKGLKSFFTNAQSRPSDYDFIVTIDGVNWFIEWSSIKTESNELNDLIDDLQVSSTYIVVHNGKRQKESGPDDPVKNFGKLQLHICRYSAKNRGRIFLLTTELESLVFDEVAPVAH